MSQTQGEAAPAVAAFPEGFASFPQGYTPCGPGSYKQQRTHTAGQRDLFSVVIPSHNRPDLLRRCLSAVTAHAPAGTEVIVVDDASPRESVRAVAELFSGVRLLRRQRRGGFCAAANAGIAAAQGEVVELLNDDTEVAAGWASAALAWFKDPTVAAVAPLVLCGPDGRRVDSAGDRYYLGGVAAKHGHGRPLHTSFLRPRVVFGASASSAFYRRSALLRVGAFPEQFGAYFEDVDLAFRLNRAGYRAVFEPLSRVLHRVSGSYGRPSRWLLQQQSSNEERVFWRNMPRGELIAALPRHLAVLLAKARRRWQEGTLAPFLCGRLRLLGELRSIWRHRQRLRELGPESNLRDGRLERRYWGTARVRDLIPAPSPSGRS
jgi:GT2 family glycosyltransferase